MQVGGGEEGKVQVGGGEEGRWKERMVRRKGRVCF